MARTTVESPIKFCRFFSLLSFRFFFFIWTILDHHVASQSFVHFRLTSNIVRHIIWLQYSRCCVNENCVRVLSISSHLYVNCVHISHCIELPLLFAADACFQARRTVCDGDRVGMRQMVVAASTNLQHMRPSYEIVQMAAPKTVPTSHRIVSLTFSIAMCAIDSQTNTDSMLMIKWEQQHQQQQQHTDVLFAISR